MSDTCPTRSFEEETRRLECPWLEGTNTCTNAPDACPWHDQPDTDAVEAALEALLPVHHICEDCWYSCPKSGDCCSDDRDGECNCGADSRMEAHITLGSAITALRARLAIDQPNPFPEGYDAIDLLNDRNVALRAENAEANALLVAHIEALDERDAERAQFRALWEAADCLELESLEGGMGFTRIENDALRATLEAVEALRPLMEEPCTTPSTISKR